MAAPFVALIGAAAGLLATGAVILGGSVAGLSEGVGGSGASASNTAVANIPAPMLDLYREAASSCPGLSWAVLAAIGTVESGTGTSDLPGVHSGANSAGAEGPMQFEPATFAHYDMPVPAGGADPPSPYDPTDAIYAAARYLCANGAGTFASLQAAIYDYNHNDAYVTEVINLAESYLAPPTPAPGPASEAGSIAVSAVGSASVTGSALVTGSAADSAAAAVDGAGVVAVDWALEQIGTPYVWGGETPGVGFDCSGLAQAAYKVAGIAIPRVAQDQYDAGPQLPDGAPLEAGDLVFFGGSATDVEHVGLVVSPGVMVDAPYTGVDVREDTFPTAVGASFGSERYIGATRPSA
jgi:cell wall-associated NlpC family hydrolase